MRKPLAIAVLLATACGNGPLSIDELNAALNDAVCRYSARCGPQANWALTACLTLRPYAANVDSVKKGMAAGRIAYDGNKARDAADDYAGLSCSSTFNRVDSKIQLDSAAVFTGKAADTAACSITQECHSGSCNTSSCPGVCHAYGTLSASCASVSCDPALGLACINSTCAKPLAASAACQHDSECQSGLNCISSVCRQPQGAGSPCSRQLDCADGLYCLPATTSSTSGACTAQVGQGGACGEDPTHANVATRECQDGLACKGFFRPSNNNTATTPGVCTPFQDENGVCAPTPAGGGTAVSGCKNGLNCPSGTCLAPPTTGPCDPNNRCRGDVAFCDTSTATHTCLPLLADNAACHNSSDCHSQHCNNGTCGPATAAGCPVP